MIENKEREKHRRREEKKIKCLQRIVQSEYSGLLFDMIEIV